MTKCATQRRAPGLQAVIDGLAKDFSISDSFIKASDHPYTCRCDSCRAWWRRMGPDPDAGRYGPFTREEIESD